SVQIEGEKITIEGTANKHYLVAEYLAGLATNSHFKHVIMFNSTVADSGQIDFSIQCDWGGTKP
ncbi:MAG: PilN domain-containing protein, partial [Methylocystaceae bacterium]